MSVATLTGTLNSEHYAQLSSNSPKVVVENNPAQHTVNLTIANPSQLFLQFAHRTVLPPGGIAPSGILNFASHDGQTKIINKCPTT